MRKVFLTAVMVLTMLLNCIPVLAVTMDKILPERVVQENTSEKTPDSEKVAIKFGGRGDEVRLVQKRLLADYGFYVGDIDGIFGRGNKQAVKIFSFLMIYRSTA